MKVDAVSLGATRLVHGSHDLIALARTVLDRAINLLEVPSLMLNALGTIRAPGSYCYWPQWNTSRQV